MNALLAIPEADLHPVLDAGIFVEERDRDPASEDDRQKAFVSAIKRDCPHIAVHATPNGGKQSDWARIRAQRMGVYAGWPDLDLDWDGGAANIEFKDCDGNPDRQQIECLNRLHRMGKHVAICRTKAAAFAWLGSIGAPV